MFTMLGLSVQMSQAQVHCNAFFPLKTGVRFEYDLFDKKDKLNGRIAQSFLNIRESGDNVVATMAQEVIDPKKNEPITRSESEWTCTDGILRFNVNSLLLSTEEGQINLGEGMSIDISGDQMEIPSNFEVGESLKDMNYNIKMMMNQLAVMDRNFLIRDRKVEGKEAITTTAGTFDCYKLTYTTESKGRIGSSITKSAVWYSKDVGMVKTENFKDNGKLINRMVLAKIEE